MLCDPGSPHLCLLALAYYWQCCRSLLEASWLGWSHMRTLLPVEKEQFSRSVDRTFNCTTSASYSGSFSNLKVSFLIVKWREKPTLWECGNLNKMICGNCRHNLWTEEPISQSVLNQNRRSSLPSKTHPLCLLTLEIPFNINKSVPTWRKDLNCIGWISYLPRCFSSSLSYRFTSPPRPPPTTLVSVPNGLSPNLPSPWSQSFFWRFYF